MLLHVVARGKIGRSAEADLIDRYAKRIAWPFRQTELPESGGKMPALQAPARQVLLDERGETFDSEAFAALLGRWRDDGNPPLQRDGSERSPQPWDAGKDHG